MSKEDKNLLSKCLDFTRSLLEKERSFTFSIKTSSGFNFNFSNQDSGIPGTRVLKKKTPSQMRRSQNRMENFVRKRKEVFGVPDTAQYELKIDAHEKCNKSDINEVLETNFLEVLKVKAKDYLTEDLKLIKIEKLEEKQIIRKVEGQFRNLQIYRLTIKDTEVTRSIVEAWKVEHQFDDRAFMNSVNSEILIKVREVAKLR